MITSNIFVHLPKNLTGRFVVAELETFGSRDNGRSRESRWYNVSGPVTEKADLKRSLRS